MAKRRQASALGQVWAERVCRGDLRQRDWPAGEPKTLAIARRLVSALATDPRLLDELARNRSIARSTAGSSHATHGSMSGFGVRSSRASSTSHSARSWACSGA